MKKIYLKKNVVVEPLCWNWYAWSHLIYPLTASMHVAHRHIPIMERFLADTNEQLAVNNQKFESGPIIQLEELKKNDIENLLSQTRSNSLKLLELADNIKSAFNMVDSQQGKSLEQLYLNLGKELKGLVELVYDINFSSGIRFIESLAYNELYDTSFQSLSFSVINSDERPFILGTPRLEDNSSFHVKCRFDSNILDKVFQSQFDGIYADDLLDFLNVQPEKFSDLLEFFTEVKPEPKGNTLFVAAGVRLRYFGHACVLLQTSEVNILIDPLISYSYSSNIERFTFEDLPSHLDYVIISHAHQDHFSIENLLKIRHKVDKVIVPRNGKGNLVDPSLSKILNKLGFYSVIEMDELDVIEFHGGKITAIPFLGEHAELDIQAKTAYSVKLKNKSFLFAADSNNFDNAIYERVFKHVDPVDVLFIGMECDGGPLDWLYGPLVTRSYDKEATKTRTLSGSDFPKAYSLAKQSGCKEAYVYSMGQEPWLNYIMNIDYTEESLQIIESNKFIKACNSINIKSERLFGIAEWNYV